jgi:hypothetical protein
MPGTTYDEDVSTEVGSHFASSGFSYFYADVSHIAGHQLSMKW